MVSKLKLCGGQCLDKVNCYNHGGSDIIIYVRSGSTWKTAHEGLQIGDIFLSLDWSRHYPPPFRAMVLGIPGDGKDCPKRDRDRLMRTYGSTAWKWPCHVIVRWNGTKFTLKPYPETDREGGIFSL